jgi:hypothetical protein
MMTGMRFLRLVLAALMVMLVGCAKNATTTTPKVPASTTTTADPVDRPAVDMLIDQIAPNFKAVLRGESGDVAAKQLSDAAAQLTAIADGLKDPAKRPRGVPPKILDDLGGALAIAGPAAADLARSLSACPAGISTPRCTDLYQKVNQGQTALINAIQGLAPWGTRPADAVQGLLYN